jgi:hypothetical protein
MPIKNCLGLDDTKLKELIKDNVEVKSAEFLIEDLKDTEIPEDDEKIEGTISKSECEKLCDSPILEFFKEFSAYVAKMELNKITIANSSNGSYDPSKLFSSLKDSFKDYKDSFSNLIKNGKGIELTNLVNKYGDGSQFPSENNLKDKKNILLDGLNKTNYYSENFGNRPLDKYRSLVLDNSDGMNKDKIFSNKDKSFLTNIPNDELENVNINSGYYKCFKPNFNLDSYITQSDFYKPPIITQEKINNLKRLHNEVLLPIYRFYYPNQPDDSCVIKIIFGLTSLETTKRNVYGSIVSKHLSGEAVDFTMNGIDSSKVISDIREGKLNIVFGTLYASNGLHVTLPYVSEGYEVKGVIIDSPTSNSNYITLEFI